jgi:LPXTG-site transpeptidase (sortase) family protein
VTKSGDPSAAQIGDTVVFTLNVFNNGDTDADNVIVTDVIPGILTINSVVIAPAGPTIGIVGNTITMDFGTLPPTDFGTIPPTNFFTVTITTTVNSSATPPGGTNNVTLTTDSPDADLTNNVDSAPIGIFGPLPETGFAPGRITRLPAQTERNMYGSHRDLWLEVPALGVEMDIVGVPLSDEGWDVSWLWNRAGYLYGTAFPTWRGNSVITGHVFLPSGLEGPFASLRNLRYGEQAIVHAWGLRYIYEIQTVEYVRPDDPDVFQSEDLSWVTLVTCSSYDETLDEYRLRVAVRAVLVAIENEPADVESSRLRVGTESHTVQMASKTLIA